VGCLALLIAFLTPRFVIVVLWLFSDYLARAFESGWLALAGFFFLPTTTMAYAVAQNEFHGAKGWGLVVLILGVMVDFGLLGGGGRAIGRHSDH